MYSSGRDNLRAGFEANYAEWVGCGLHSQPKSSQKISDPHSSPSLIAAKQSVHEIPKGFALVPVEPTDGCRVEVGFEVIDRKHVPTVTIKMPPISAEDSKGWDRRDKVAQAIRAMLAAAPKGDSHE